MGPRLYLGRVAIIMRVTLVCLSNHLALQKYTAYAAQELSRWHSVSLLTSIWFDRKLVPSNVQHYPVGTTRTPRLDPQMLNPIALYRMRVALRQARPEIVHFTTAHPLHLALALFVSRVPKVFTIHDPVPHPNEPATRFVELYNRLVFGGVADRVIVHAKTAFSVLQSLGIDTTKVRYAPLGGVYGPLVPPAYPPEPALLFFGRIRPYKGVEVYLEAARHVADRMPGVRIILAGEGDLSPCRHLLSLPNLEVENRFIPDSEEEYFFSRAQAVVLPYTSATQSGVIPVAYAYARPVVSTRVGSLPEMVLDGKTGFLVQPGDAVALAEKCLVILQDPGRGAQMGAWGRRYFEEHLTPRAMAEHFNEVYLELRAGADSGRSG